MPEETLRSRPTGRILAVAAAVVLPAVLTWLFWRTTPPVGGYLTAGASTPHTASTPYEPASSAGPEAVFAQNCASCHGARLEGGKGGALRRPDWPYGENRSLLVRVISEGRGLTMPPFRGRLSALQIEALADWIQAQNRPSGTGGNVGGLR